MKVLVLSVTSGEGHNAMGKAVISYLKDTGHDGKMIDYFVGIDDFRQKLANDTYFWTLKHFPKTSHRTYMKILERDFTKQAPKGSIFSMMLNSKKAIEHVEETINEYQPDFIFCTHCYTATLMSHFKDNGKYLDIPSFFIVSDYVVHAYTENARHVDYLLTPCTDFDDELIQMGFNKKQFLPFGIVANMKFAKRNDKCAARKSLGLDENMTTFLVMNGGVGFGKNDKLVEKLSEIDRPFQLIVVNGRNKKMQTKIDELISKGQCKNTLNLGFVNNVDVLMDASDAMLGKIGGAGIAEAFNKGLTVIVTGNPPFQEFSNLIYLGKRDIVVPCKDLDTTKDAVVYLLDHPERLKQLRDNVTEISKPNATKDFVEFMEKLYANKHK